jgi:DNA helicase IV
LSLENLAGAVDKDVVIQQEQRYFDRAFDCMMDADARWVKAALTGGTAVERRALKRAASKRQVPAPEEPVAFGRMVGEDGESFYIGKAPIFDAEKNLLVINWQAPAAARYNQATPSDPQGLLWRRSFTAPHNHIEDLSDLHFQEIAEQLQDLEEVAAYPAQEDDLLEALRRKRTGEMADIVSTIQAAQDQLIRADKDQLLVIQGGPGTGKTAVALHRVSWLLYTFDQEIRPQDVLVVGPNQTFTRYIQKVLPGLGDEDVYQIALDRLLANGVTRRGVDPDPVAIIKGSKPMAAVVKRALWQRVAIPAEGVVIDMSSFRRITVSKDALRTLVENLHKLPYSQGRQQFSERLASYCAEYQASVSSRGHADTVVPASLEQAVERVWKKLSPQQFLRELYGSKQRLTKANKVNLLSEEQVQLLHRPSVRAMSEEPWTRDDLALIDYASFLMNGAERQYRHIVVDEAQDLSYMELLALKHRSSSGSMTVVGDLAQSTGPHAHDSWGEVAEALDQGQTQDVSELEYGYRVPQQVFDLARPVLAAAAPTVRAPDILREIPYEPAWSFPASAELAEAVAQKVIERSRGYFMGVIAHPEHWEALRAAFSAAGINWAESTSGELSTAINLVTPEDAKGLEFDSVIVVDPQRIIDMPHGLRLLYIALTRTTTRLDLVVPRERLPEILAGKAPEIPPLPAVQEDLPQTRPSPSNETTAPGPEAPTAPAHDHNSPTPLPVNMPLIGNHSPRFEALPPWAKPVVQSYLAQQIHHLEGGDYSPKMIEAIVEELHRHYLGQ